MKDDKASEYAILTKIDLIHLINNIAVLAPLHNISNSSRALFQASCVMPLGV